MARTVLVPISWTEEPLNRELRCPGLGLRPRFLSIQPQPPLQHLDPIAPWGSSALVPDYLKLWIWVLVYLQFPFLLCSAMHWNILSIMFDPGLLFLVSCHGGYFYLLASAHSWLVLCVRPTPNFFQGFLFWRLVTNWTEVSYTNTWFPFPPKYLRFCEAIFSRYFIVIQGIWGFLSLFLWMLYDYVS